MSETPQPRPRMTNSEADFLREMAEYVVQHIGGDFAEVGVYQGGSALILVEHIMPQFVEF